MIYKRGKGNISRGLRIAILGAVALFGCRELYLFLLHLGLNPLAVPGVGVIKWAYIVTGLLGGTCAVGIFLLMNSRRVVDFLLETETELKKVSWSPRGSFSATQ